MAVHGGDDARGMCDSVKVLRLAPLPDHRKMAEGYFSLVRVRLRRGVITGVGKR